MDELKELRNKIDALDEELVKTLNRRFQLSLLVGKVKERNGQSVLVSKRETEIKERLRLASLPEFEASIQRVYNAIFEESRGLQDKKGGAHE